MEEKTPYVVAPQLVTVQLTQQWARLLAQLQQARNDDIEAAVILLRELKLGSVIAFEAMRK